MYEVDGQILRGVRSDFAKFYADLLADPCIHEMIGREIVETAVSPTSLDGYPLTLQHRKVSPISYCYEWPALMLRDAARLTLDVCLKIVDRDLVLQDAYPGNILFDGPRPIFVDYTSLVPQDPNLLWVAYDQFCRFFLFPLVLAQSGLGWIARALLLDQINGISPEDAVRLLPSRSLARMPWLLGKLYLPHLVLRIARRLSTDEAWVRLSHHLKPTPNARRAFFTSLRKTVTAMTLPIARSGWSHYCADMEPFLQASNLNDKQKIVLRILEARRPRTVVDIGCNRGGYAVLAARSGARVTAFDSDEASVSHLYRLAGDRSLDILPLVMNVVNPSPSCGWRGIEHPAAPQRLRSEMGLALALVHHLAITQRQTFERIVPALADYSERWLLTEFVPLDDERSRELLATNRRDMTWYSLEGLLGELKRLFPMVETFRSHPEGRTLILCER